MLVMVTIFCINIVWAVTNWYNEYEFIIAVYKNPTSSIGGCILSPVYLLLDIGITAGATTIFGFSGFYGAAMAIFMSNVLSVAFFTPKGKNKQILKDYRLVKNAHKRGLSRLIPW